MRRHELDGRMRGQMRRHLHGQGDRELHGQGEGNFKGPKCMGQCKGTCSASGSVMCNGKCNGTCSYTPGSATCSGECHGSCSAETSPPRCTGTLDCMASAECNGSCDAAGERQSRLLEAASKHRCRWRCQLQQALEAHIGAWGEAFNLTLQLKDPIAKLAAKSAATFQALGDIGVSGLSCVGSSLEATAKAQASISVSVSASASIKSN